MNPSMHFYTKTKILKNLLQISKHKIKKRLCENITATPCCQKPLAPSTIRYPKKCYRTKAPLKATSRTSTALSSPSHGLEDRKASLRAAS